MKNVFTLSFMLLLFAVKTMAAPPPDSILPVRGFCIGAPHTASLDAFIKFIREELAPRQVNTLILRIDYNYQYEKHPELSDSGALSKKDVKKLVQV